MSPAVAAAKSRVPEGVTTADAGEPRVGLSTEASAAATAKRLAAAATIAAHVDPRGPPSRWSSAATRAPSESEAAAAVVTFVTVVTVQPPHAGDLAGHGCGAVAASTGSSATILSTPRGIEPGTSPTGSRAMRSTSHRTVPAAQDANACLAARRSAPTPPFVAANPPTVTSSSSCETRAARGSLAAHAIAHPHAPTPYARICLDTSAPALTRNSPSSRLAKLPGAERKNASSCEPVGLSRSNPAPVAPRSARRVG